MTIQTTISPTGERLVTMTAAEYEDLVDARDAAVAMRDVASGAMETFSDAETDAYLSAKTPLAFYRRHRGLAQDALAASAGISQAYLSQLERGAREGSPRLLRALARALRVRIEDLIGE
jgi:DNA-binding XRE family transcriptional regulator